MPPDSPTATRRFAYPSVRPWSDVPSPPPLLAALSPADWARVLVTGRRLHLQPGTVLAEAGSRERVVHLLLTGSVDAGEDVVEAPATLGLGAFFGSEAPAASVVARSGGAALRLGFADIERLAGRDPALARQLLLALARALAREDPGENGSFRARG